MVVILTGAKKNVGDYLIGSRARKLLRDFVAEDIVELSRFEKLDSHIDTINSSKCLILCGGPAYASDIYPSIYPLVADLADIKVPIVPFGLGWSGQPAGSPLSFRFTPESKTFLERVHTEIPFSSCRDNVTHEVLRNNGIRNVLMTGCPVWYSVPHLGQSLEKSEFKRIVFTTPANPRLAFQSAKLMSLLRRKFPHAEIICSFHRGILPDSHTTLKSSAVYAAMALYARKLGFEVKDVSYSLDKIDFYQTCDFHVGYRVHAHLDFVSRRWPSLLINEDGRGIGMVRSLDMIELNHNDPSLLERYERALDEYAEYKMEDLERGIDVIEASYENMKRFLQAI